MGELVPPRRARLSARSTCRSSIQVAGSVRAKLQANAVTEPLVTKDINAIGSGMVQAPH